MRDIKYCVLQQDVYLAKRWKAEDLYMDDQVFSLVVSPVMRKGNVAQYQLALLKDGHVMTYGEWNRTLRKNTRAAYLEHLMDSLFDVLNNKCSKEEEFSVGINFGVFSEKPETVDLEQLPIRMVLFCKNSLPLPPAEEERIRFQIKNELVDWLEQVYHDVLKEVPLSEEEKNYQAMVGAAIIPHEKTEGDWDMTMTIISIVCLIASLFLREWFIPQIMAIFAASCTAYRSFQHKNYICVGICAVVIVLGAVISLVAYQELKESMSGAAMLLQQGR